MKKFNPKDVYKAGEEVTHNGETYTALRTTMGKDPETKSHWTKKQEPVVSPKIDKPKVTKPIAVPTSKAAFKPHVVIVEQKGVDGKDGKDGRDGIDGRHGIDGAPGIPGRDGVDGRDGKDGKDGQVIYVDKESDEDKKTFLGLGGGSSNKHRIYPASATGVSLVQKSLPSRSSLKTLVASTNMTITDNGNGTISLSATGGGGLSAIAAYSTLSNNTNASAVPVASQAFILGTPGYTTAGANLSQFTANSNTYAQLSVQNLSSGASASSDFVATADNGTDTTHYINLGINGSGGSATPFTAANAGYLYSTDAELDIGALAAGGVVNIYTTGTTSAPVLASTFTATQGLTVVGALAASNFSGTSSGTNTGDQTNITGNAGTVTTINGRIAAGTNISITGTGTAASPYTIAGSAGGVTSVTGDGTLINNSASTGAVTLTRANASAYSVLGNNTSSSASPSYQTSIKISGGYDTSASSVGYNINGNNALNINSTNTIALGTNAGLTGTQNMIIGPGAFQFGNGNFNVAIGNSALFKNTGASNVAIGTSAINNATATTTSVAIGANVGPTLTTGTNVILIGSGADVPSGGTSNYISIGGFITGTYNSTSTAVNWNAPIAINAAQTVVNGSGSGTATFSQPQQGGAYKKVIVYCAALLGTASYTFPTAFTNTPAIVTTNGPAAGVVTSLSTSAMTITGTTTTGFLIIEGY